MVAKQDWFDHAAVDEEGGADISTPDDENAGRLKSMMAKPERFANGGEVGIAKSAMAVPSF